MIFFHRSFKAYFKVELDMYQPHWFTFLRRVMEFKKKNVNHPPKSVFPIVCWIKGHYKHVSERNDSPSLEIVKLSVKIAHYALD